MRNNGFTLVELLGVIVILGIILAITTITVTGILNDSSSKLTNIQIEKLKDAAKNYYIAEGMTDLDYEQTSFSHCVNVEYLLENGYIDSNEVSNFETYEEMLGSVRIHYNGKKYNYSYVEDSCKICSLKDDVEPTGISVGDKYQCKVKADMEIGFEDGYYFYVLSKENDGTTNLIMERNIYYDSTKDVGLVATSSNTGLVKWYESEHDNCYGPVTAIEYLHNATKDWDNIPNMMMNYEDENINFYAQQERIYGYGGIKTIDNITIITSNDNEETGRIENLKTRLPKYDEVHGIDKCLTEKETGNKYGSCPLWLVNYLHTAEEYSTEDGKVEIDKIDGYWTLSSNSDPVVAMSVYKDGIVFDDDIYDEYNGVRPVITIPNQAFENNNW